MNLLTADVVREASAEIQTGKHVQLDWPLNNLEHPGMGRIPFHHKVKNMVSEGFEGLDDEIHINTQTSSQWDSLKHVSYGRFDSVSYVHFGLRSCDMTLGLLELALESRVMLADTTTSLSSGAFKVKVFSIIM